MIAMGREHMIFLCFIAIVVCVQGIFPNDTIVTLPDGKIQGYVDKTFRHGKTFYSFLGIPFAAPPVGNLRFKPPQPVESWDGVLQTMQLTKTCYQVQRSVATESEDCLYLDVFTPVVPSNESTLPVMVDIYGGAYIHGGAIMGNLRPQNLIEKDVVVVSFNYRIGPFGFLSTGDTVIPGNMGLKDQQMALKWVQNNIHLFGGDPDKVTIMGKSAGGASVSYHILSPGSAGLFRAAIAQSASALCNWAHQGNPADIAYGLASAINSNVTREHSSEELLDFLLSVNASDIAATGDKYHFFSPVIEMPNEGAFITEPMHELVKEGRINKVPLLIGICSEEQIAHLGALSLWQRYVRQQYVPQKLVEAGMNLRNRSELLTVGQKIRDIYTNESFDQHLGKSVQFCSDTTYNRPVIRFAELQSNYTDVYFYQFSFQGKICNNGLSCEGVSGVGHADDMKYLWTYFKSLKSFPEADVKTMDRYIGLFTNFAKFLDPIPETDELFNVTLPKMTRDEMYYLDIREELEVKKNPREFSYQKWVDLYEEYGQSPFATF